VKKSFFDLKLWGPLKNFKTGSGLNLGLGLSINVKNGMKISVDCPFKIPVLAAGRSLPLTSRFTSELGQVVGCTHDADV
jgi:hypothetical protein